MRKSTKKNEGMTLIEIMVTVAVGALVIGAAFRTITTTNDVQDHAFLQAAIDNQHLNAVQTARSFSQLRRILLNVDAAGNPVPSDPLVKCFSRKGAGCHAFETPWKPLNDTKGDLNSRYSRTLGKCAGSTRTCVIQRMAEYRIFCQKDHSCEAVEIHVKTSFDGPARENTLYFAREGTFRVPGGALTARGEIDFSCAAGGKLVVAIDYDKLTATCRAFTGFNGTADGLNPKDVPITSFGGAVAVSLQKLVAGPSCPSYGAGQLGLFEGEGTCAPAPAP